MSRASQAAYASNQQQQQKYHKAGGSGGGTSPPANTIAPAVTGTVTTGNTLSCSSGTWTGSPTFGYQWQRAGVNIGSATAATYVLVTADEAQAITCVVTGTNAGGSATGTSNTVTPPANPVNTVAPAITTDGTPTTWETISCSTGTWTGTATITYTYQWKRAGVDIAGQTAATHQIVVADEGAALTCVVTATNTGAAVTAVSAGVTPAAWAPPAGLALWFKADALSLNDADPVATWTDSSGNTRNAAQNTAGFRPIYKTGIVNGRPVVRFDGIDDVLSTPSWTSDVVVTHFAVAKLDAVGTVPMVTTRAPSQAELRTDGAPHHIQMTGVTLSATSAAVWTLGTWLVLTGYFDSGAADLMSIQINGGTANTNTDAGTLTLASISNVGGRAATFPFGGDIAEVLTFSTAAAMSQANRQSVERYLGNKYAITVA